MDGIYSNKPKHGRAKHQKIFFLTFFNNFSQENEMLYGTDSVSSLGTHSVNSLVSISIPRIKITVQHVLYL
jgi:hypothetical protein